MVGAVLDALESLSIREKTVVFFSGDNGPDDHPFGLFDDPGIFRGKKRSLHEGGIRQTIVVSWPGTITAGATSDQIFTFWDLLPTAADIAGLPKSEWPNVDGISALPLFQNSTVPAPDRYLYYEFCKAGSVDGKGLVIGTSLPLRWGAPPIPARRRQPAAPPPLNYC